MTEAERHAVIVQRICWICYGLAGIAATTLAFFVIFVLGDRHPVIEYGGPGSVSIVSVLTGESTVTSGEPTNICYKGIKWYRRCDTDVLQQLEYGGMIVNLPVHHVSPSPYANKCRPLGIMWFPREFKGDVKFSGTAKSTCWPTDIVWPLEVPLPDAHFTVR